MTAAIEGLSASISSANISRQVYGALIENDWVKCVCRACSSEFMAKPNAFEPSLCDHSNCLSGPDFIERKPPPKNPTQLLQLVESFKSFFSDDEQTRVLEALPLIRPLGNSSLVSSTGQVYDKYFFGRTRANDDLTEGRAALAQPVIRLKGKPVDGSTRSFVNLGLEQISIDCQSHMQNLDRVFDWLSAAGIYIPDIKLKVEHSKENWGNGFFEGVTTRLFYGGVELGVANYFPAVPASSGEQLSFSDVSLGAERIQWAITKAKNYRSVIAPPEQAEHTPLPQIDALRTLVLAATGNVCLTSQADYSGRMRQILRENIAKPGQCIDFGLLKHYARFWGQLLGIDVPQSPEEIFDTLDRLRKRFSALGSACVSFSNKEDS